MRRVLGYGSGCIGLMIGLVGLISMPAASGRPAPISTVARTKPPITHSPYRESAADAHVSEAGRIALYGQSRLVGKYSGVWKTQNGIMVAAKQGSESQVRDELAKEGLADGITVVSARNSYDSLMQLTLRIAHDPQVRKLGLSSWGPDPQSNMVVAYLVHFSKAAAAAVINRYGPDLVTVAPGSHPSPTTESASSPPAGRASNDTLLTRASDFSPFYGGDGYWWSGKPVDIWCTTGIPVRGNVHPEFSYVLSAGHCAPVGAKVGTDETRHTPMGYVTNRRFGNGLIDSETIGGESWLPVVWGGGPTSTVAYNIVGNRFSQPGELVALSGARTGEVRNNKVLEVNQCTEEQEVVTCYTTKTFIATTASQPGDSGGPVFQHTTADFNNVMAEGTIVGSAYAHYGDQDGQENWYNQIIDLNNYFKTHTDTLQ